MRLFKMNIDDVEPISCTDLKQKWGKSSMSRRSKGIFRADELRKMCHFKPKTFKDPPIPDSFGQFVRDAFKTGNPTCELSLSMGKKRCTICKPKKMSTMHKSVVRAIRTLTKSPSCKIIVQNGKANIPRKQASTQQQPSPILNPQPGSEGKPLEKVTLKCLVPIKGIVLGKKPENLPLIPPTPERFTVRKTYASRGTTHCKHQGKEGIRSDIVQVRPDQQALKPICTNTVVSNIPCVASVSSPPDTHHDEVVSALLLLGVQSPLAPAVPIVANGTDTKSPLSRSVMHPLNEETHPCLNKENRPERQCPPRPSNSVKNKGTGAITVEQRRQKWADISKRRLPPPPSRVISKTYLYRLLHQKLPVNVTPEPFQCPEDEDYFFRNICVTAEEADKLFFSTTGQSKSDVWLAARRRRFTGSVCYKLFTPKTSLNDKPFWNLKLKSLLEEKFLGNFNTRRGRWKMKRSLVVVTRIFMRLR